MNFNFPYPKQDTLKQDSTLFYYMDLMDALSEIYSPDQAAKIQEQINDSYRKNELSDVGYLRCKRRISEIQEVYKNV